MPSLRLLLLLVLALLPLGINSAIYHSSASHLAASLGLSLDEASWLYTLFQWGHLGAFPLAAWLCQRMGERWLMRLGAWLGLTATLLSLATLAQPAGQLASWLLLGVAGACLMMAAQAITLRNLDYSGIALAEGLMMLAVTILPLGLYPWLLSWVAENHHWWHSLLLQLPIYLLLLAMVHGDKWPVSCHRDGRLRSFSVVQMLLLTGLILSVSYLLLRGNRFNWLDDAHIVDTVLVVAACLTGLVVAIRQRWGGDYLRFKLFAEDRHQYVGFFDAALGGFVIFGTSVVIGAYVGGVMGYSHEQAGWLQLPGLMGMLAGCVVTVMITKNPRLNPEKVIPIGVIMVVVSSYLLAGSNAGSGMADMWPAIVLRGFAVGLLNVGLTTHIMRSLPRPWIPEGVALFYLFRSLGAFLGLALMQRLVYVNTLNSVSVLGQNFNPSDPVFMAAQQQAAAVLQQQGAPVTPETVAGLLQPHLLQQAQAVAGVEVFMWVIVCLALLAPVMAGLLAWAKAKH